MTNWPYLIFSFAFIFIAYVFLTAFRMSLNAGKKEKITLWLAWLSFIAGLVCLHGFFDLNHENEWVVYALLAIGILPLLRSLI